MAATLDGRVGEGEVYQRAIGINLGLDPERKGWLVYLPSLNVIKTMYHGTFQETKFMMFRDDNTVLQFREPEGIP